MFCESHPAHPRSSSSKERALRPEQGVSGLMEWLIVQERLNHRANANISSWCKIGPWQKPFPISSQHVIWVLGGRTHVLIWSGTWGEPCQVKKRGQCTLWKYRNIQTSNVSNFTLLDETKMPFETLRKWTNGQISSLDAWTGFFFHILIHSAYDKIYTQEIKSILLIDFLKANVLHFTSHHLLY